MAHDRRPDAAHRAGNAVIQAAIVAALDRSTQISDAKAALQTVQGASQALRDARQALQDVAQDGDATDLALATALVSWGWLALAVALAARVYLAIRVDRALRRSLSPTRLALLPLRDALSFAIWGLGLARGTVTWQGRRYRMRRDGSMVDAAS